jgi:ubiquinone/menaquinone biosynthesis C-methylase UbiE
MGVDMSDEMIRQAREKNESFPNIIYHCAGADSIPVFDNYFTKIISIEAFYYFEQQERVLRELLRVTEAGGQLFLLICTFRGDQKTHSWADEVGLPLHNRSTQEYEQMLRHCGWTDVASRVFDFRSDPATHLGEHDRPLLLIARKRR